MWIGLMGMMSALSGGRMLLAAKELGKEVYDFFLHLGALMDT